MDAEQLNVADGVGEAVEELVFSEVMGAHLDSTQNNCKLLGKVTRVAKAALVDLVETMEEFHALSTDAFVEIIADAWIEAHPGAVTDDNRFRSDGRYACE